MAEIFCLSLIEIGLINLPKYDKDQSSPHVAIHSGSPVHNIARKTTKHLQFFAPTISEWNFSILFQCDRRVILTTDVA
jgi:hypothetical protein